MGRRREEEDLTVHGNVALMNMEEKGNKGIRLTMAHERCLLTETLHSDVV